MPSVETCGNCDRAIGKMEQACLYGGRVVCQACHDQLSGAPVTVQTIGVRTVEQTGKQYKAMMLISGVLTCLGVADGCSNTTEFYVGEDLGGGAIFVGLGLFIIARIMAWWHHG